MKKLLILIVAVFLFSCTDHENGKHDGFFRGTQQVSGAAIESGYQTVVIEGCEYIYYSEYQGYSGYGFMAHKGNCKNPIHRIQIQHDTIYLPKN